MHKHEWYCISHASRFNPKKKKIHLPTLLIFWPKGQTNLLFFRPNINASFTGRSHKFVHKLILHNLYAGIHAQQPQDHINLTANLRSYTLQIRPWYFFLPYINYGILIWGKACDMYLCKIHILQK